MTDISKKLYGTWPSPLSTTDISEIVRLNDVSWDNSSSALVWAEGKGLIFAQIGVDAPLQLNAEARAARGKVGYGGGAMTVAGGDVYFVSNRIFRVSIADARSRALTPQFGDAASLKLAPDGKWLLYVHSYEHKESLGLVDSAGKHWPRRLISGSDFYMQPTWHPDGKSIAFISWDHPQMPWDGTLLNIAQLDADDAGMLHVVKVETIAGSEQVSIFQPEFSPDGRYLAYVSDETGFGQIYLYDLETGQHTQLTEAEAEHGTPAWLQGMRTYVWSPDSQSLYVIRNDAGFCRLYHLDLQTRTPRLIDALADYTHISQPAISSRGELAMIAESSTLTPRVVAYDPETRQVRIHRRSSRENIQQKAFAAAQAISWQGHDGETVYGLYYPPTSVRFAGSGQPPLIITIHGGPTSQRTASFSAEAQSFATRGYAVLEVNYRGGTGYGREYMLKGRGAWGIYDVEDAASGALYLAEQGLADKDKFVIMGGSSGGFTVLQSLITKPGFYAAGISRYGVANHFLMAQDTHKFEERYLDSLLGPLPEAVAIYRERSPQFFAEKIVDPLLIFQGSEDTVVPKAQSDDLVATLKARGIPHEYVVYEGEGHGFRKPENIRDYYEKLLRFLEMHVIYA